MGEAPDGASALAAARGLEPNVVLLNVVLPVGGGLAVAERIAREHARVRVANAADSDVPVTGIEDHIAPCPVSLDFAQP